VNWLRPSGQSDGFPDAAVAAQTSVVYERSQWVVYLEIIFRAETRRYRIEAYRSERQARIAADWIERAAQRELPHPPTGM